MAATSEIVKEFKAVIDALDAVSTLEGALQQQLSKTDTSQHDEVAQELSTAFAAHKALVDRRRELLRALIQTPPGT
jgi:ABC-type transporter Mla subunit MlaD